MPSNNYNLNFQIVVVLSDGRNPNINGRIRMTGVPQNDAPVLNNPIPNFSLRVGDQLCFVIPAPTFFDVDGDMLQYKATLNGGSNLPSWLLFIPNGRTFSGVPSLNDLGMLTIRVSVSDPNNTTVSTTFQLNVVNALEVNNIPKIITYVEDTSYTFSGIQISTSQLTISVRMTLQQPQCGSLSVGVVANTVSFYDIKLGVWQVTGPVSDVNTMLGQTMLVPTANFNQNMQISVVVSDGFSPDFTASINVTGIPVNDPPSLVFHIPKQTAVINTVFSFTFDSITFGDPDGDALSYTALLKDNLPLPTWLSFDSTARSFTGTPTAENVGVVTLRVIASDGKGGMGWDEFEVAVSATGDQVTNINNNGKKGSSADEIIAATVSTVVGGLILAGLGVCWKKREKVQSVWAKFLRKTNTTTNIKLEQVE